jgi:hypothetical protein
MNVYRPNYFYINKPLAARMNSHITNWEQLWCLAAILLPNSENYWNVLLTVYIWRYKFSILSVAEVGCYRFNFNPFSNTPLPLRGVE